MKMHIQIYMFMLNSFLINALCLTHQNIYDVLHESCGAITVTLRYKSIFFGTGSLNQLKHSKFGTAI